MNAKEAIASLFRVEPAKLAKFCPWCHQPLEGDVFVSFRDGVVLAVTQTKRVGNNRYTWAHSEESCCVPALNRPSPFKVI